MMNNKEIVSKMNESADFIKSKLPKAPKLAIVLGSGWGPFVDKLSDSIRIPYTEIPHFHQTSVAGHSGTLVYGELQEVPVVILQGRFHYYEGHPISDVVHPTRTLCALGVDTIILTNASGGINTSYKPGDLVVINDHINMTGVNPLLGPNIEELGTRFPDMSCPYDETWMKALNDAAAKTGVKLQTGVYAGVTGPTYETPAEVKMLRTLGADLVGMSTVPEVIAARHMGTKVCALSCVTNMASGIEKEELKHEDIQEQAIKVIDSFSTLMTECIQNYYK
jgi:purine-nucleoside phosphorylase